MKRRFLILVLAVLTVGLLGSCKKINERIDGLDQRVDNIEQEKIASIQNQIAAINASIADLGTIRKDILDLQVAVGAKGEDISELQAADKAIVQRLSELQAADAAIEKRINELKTVVGDLSRYAEKDWATATFATLEQLNATNSELSALKEIVEGLGGIIDEKIAKVKSSLSASISSAIRGVNASISELEARVIALEQMIQSVTLVQAYSDGSVRDEDGKLSLELVVSPASAAIGLTASDFKVLVTEVTTITKASSIQTLDVESFVNKGDGNLTLTVDISDCTPTTGHSLAVAVNVVKGKSDLTTEFVTVSAAPDPVLADYVEIAAKYNGSTVSTLRWYKQNLAITASGKKAWNGGSGSAVKVPGTDEDVVIGDYFQWGTFTGFYGNGTGTDKGLLPYTSFTSTGCGDGSNNFTFKDGKLFDQANAPYWSGSAYTKYYGTDNKTTLDASDDAASIILGDTWRMPTADEFQAMTAVTYWAWDETDTGYYVYTPNPASDAGKVNDGTGTYNKADALLFFPTAGNGHEETYYNVGEIADYWYGSLNSAVVGYACHLYFNSSGSFNQDSKESDRFRGFSVRPVQDPAATYVAVTNVSLDETSKNITVGGNLQLKATVIPDDATQQGVYWTSSAPTVATVDATGKVTAVAAGTATITATTVDGSKTATCEVTVTSPAPSISTIADVLATVDGGFPQGTGSKTPSGDAWVCGSDRYTFVFQSDQNLFLGFYYSSYNGGTGNATGALLTTPVTQEGENCYTATTQIGSPNPTITTLKFQMTAGKLTSINYSSSNNNTNEYYGGTYTAPGVFSVSANKKVCFSKGNLWYGKVGSATTDTWNFETNQYDVQSNWTTSHVSHFFWSKSASVAYAASYSDGSAAATDVFFTNADAETAKADFTVSGMKGFWRTLSAEEWKYLINTSARMVNHKPCYSTATSGVTIGSTTYKGIFLYPDNYNGATVSSSMTWEQIEAAGIVFLPAAGSRENSDVSGVDDNGYYWSSSAYNDAQAYRVNFFSTYVNYNDYIFRSRGHSVRLVTDVPAK